MFLCLLTSACVNSPTKTPSASAKEHYVNKEEHQETKKSEMHVNEVKNQNNRKILKTAKNTYFILTLSTLAGCLLLAPFI
jgi:hypothetical protein